MYSKYCTFSSPYSTHGIHFEQNIFTECTRYEKLHYVHTILFDKGFNVMGWMFIKKNKLVYRRDSVLLGESFLQ